MWFSLTLLALYVLQASHLNGRMQNTCVHLQGSSLGQNLLFKERGKEVEGAEGAACHTSLSARLWVVTIPVDRAPVH